MGTKIALLCFSIRRAYGIDPKRPFYLKPAVIRSLRTGPYIRTASARIPPFHPWVSAFPHMFFLRLLLVAVVAAAAATTTSTLASSSVSPTLIWVTGTDEQGVLQTTQSPYHQSFAIHSLVAADVPSGAIGLGSLSGTVGHIRTYDQATVSVANAGSSHRLSDSGRSFPLATLALVAVVSFAGFYTLLFV